MDTFLCPYVRKFSNFHSDVQNQHFSFQKRWFCGKKGDNQTNNVQKRNNTRIISFFIKQSLKKWPKFLQRTQHHKSRKNHFIQDLFENFKNLVNIFSRHLKRKNCTKSADVFRFQNWNFEIGLFQNYDQVSDSVSRLKFHAYPPHWKPILIKKHISPISVLWVTLSDSFKTVVSCLSETSYIKSS